jgi:hypothetical protein
MAKGRGEVTSKKAASNDAKVLRDPKASKAAKSAAGSALTQRPGKKRWRTGVGRYSKRRAERLGRCNSPTPFVAISKWQTEARNPQRLGQHRHCCVSGLPPPSLLNVRRISRTASVNLDVAKGRTAVIAQAAPPPRRRARPSSELREQLQRPAPLARRSTHRSPSGLVSSMIIPMRVQS